MRNLALRFAFAPGPGNDPRRAVRAHPVLLEAIGVGAVAARHGNNGLGRVEFGIDEAAAWAGHCIGIRDLLVAPVLGAVQEDARNRLRTAASLPDDEVEVAVMVDVHVLELVHLLVAGDVRDLLSGPVPHAYAQALLRQLGNGHHGRQAGPDSVRVVARGGILAGHEERGQCRQRQESFHAGALRAVNSVRHYAAAACGETRTCRPAGGAGSWVEFQDTQDCRDALRPP
jgi:hypothetical protein